MTTNHHTAITTGAAANASTIETPLAQLDQAITDIVTTEKDGHVIQDEGVDVTQQQRLNFVGAGVEVTNDAGNNRTVVTIQGYTEAITPPQGRLTLTSGVSITVSNVTGATTLYYTPASGNYVPCIVSGTLAMRTFTELSQATTDTTKSPAAVAADKVYDIFLWDNSGTLRATRGPAWASDTSRGTGAATSEVEFVNGFYVNKYAITNGPGAGLGILIGSVRSNASSQLVDSDAFRWVSNLYNAVPRKMRIIESTDSWNYTTSAWRQARASTANQLDYLQCMSGGLLEATVMVSHANSGGSSFGCVAVGIDSTTTPSDYLNTVSYSPAAGTPVGVSAYYGGVQALGRHYAVWLEYGPATGTTTWYGDAGATLVSQAGIAGSINN